MHVGRSTWALQLSHGCWMDTSAASLGTGGTHSGGEPVVELVPAPLGFFALFGRE